MPLRVNTTAQRLLFLWRQTIKACGYGCSILFAAAAISGELLELSVEEADDEYTLRIVAVLAAPEEYVYRVITDYRHAYRISPAITRVDLMPSHQENVIRVRHRSVHRVGLFAFELEWAGDIVANDEGRVEITTIPELSSFESGSAIWEIRPQGDNTWVHHESRLKPKFYVLPIIGDYLMKEHLRQETLAIFDRVECHAQSLLEMDMQEDLERRTAALNRSENCAKLLAMERSEP